MKIIKFKDYIREDNVYDTPEEYINTALGKFKKKIESFFKKTGEENQTKNMSDALEKGKKHKEKNLSLSELGVTLESSEISKFSSLYDNVTIKFSDPEFRYDLFITIPIDEGIPKDTQKNFDSKDIKKCFIKFKKYNISQDFELIGQISKNVEIDKIDEEFLVNLKIELDDEFDDNEKELEIETK